MGECCALRLARAGCAVAVVDVVRVLATQERLAAIRRRVPMQRMGSVDEIGKAALFLASDLASFVTGRMGSKLKHREGSCCRAPLANR
jgi:NAD(P)-dependent dehydrogenase (short-subunit alcohol dehydrogenase family)